jgi:hypothetical protein
MDVEDHGNRSFRGVFGRLIGVLAPPGIDPGPVAFD